MNWIDAFQVFEFIYNFKNFFTLKEMSIGRREILTAFTNLYLLNLIDHLTYEKIQKEENQNKETQKKYLENFQRGIEYLSSFIEKAQPSKSQKTNNKTFMKMIEDFLEENFNFDRYRMTEVKFICFGSYSNGFALKNSDIDAIILTNNYVGCLYF